MTNAEALRLQKYATSIVTLEYPYSVYSGLDRNPPHFLLDQLVEGWRDFVLKYPMLFGVLPETQVTLTTLFPRLRQLRGSTGDFINSRTSRSISIYTDTTASFTVPLNPIFGILQPLCRVYAHRATSVPIIASASTQLTLDSNSLNPKTFLDIRRNKRLTSLEVRGGRNWLVYDEWIQVALKAGWNASDADAILSPQSTKPPLQLLSLHTPEVHHVFTKLISPNMFGPITHLRVLHLGIPQLQSITRRSAPSYTSDSDPPTLASVSESESESDVSVGILPTLRGMWPRITRRIIRSEDSNQGSDEGAPRAVMPGHYSPTATTPSFLGDFDTTPIPGSMVTIPLTAAALETLQAPTLTEEAAAAAGHQTSDDNEGDSSSSSSDVLQDSDAQPPPNHLPLRSTDFSDYFSDSSADSPNPTQPPGGFDAFSPAFPHAVPQPPSDRSDSPLPPLLDVSTADSDDGEYAQHFPNLWHNHNHAHSSTDSEDLVISSWASNISMEAASSPTLVPPPDRSFVQLIASSSPRLEILVFEGNWDWTRLVSAMPTHGPMTGTGIVSWEHELHGLTRVEVRLGAEYYEANEEDRAAVLVGGIEDAMKRWRKGKRKDRRNK